MAKRYIRINYQNSPSTLTPVNATNLNKMDKGIDDIDDALETLLGDLADAFSALLTYAVGDYCIYNNILYKCTTAITVAAEWNASKWTVTTVGKEIDTLNDNLANSFTITDISSLLLPGWESFDANTKPKLIRAGKLCLIRGIVKCTDISKGGILGNLPVLPTTYAGSICECFSDKAIGSIYVTTYPNAGLVYQDQGNRPLTLNASYIINATYYTS